MLICFELVIIKFFVFLLRRIAQILQRRLKKTSRFNRKQLSVCYKWIFYSFFWFLYNLAFRLLKNFWILACMTLLCWREVVLEYICCKRKAARKLVKSPVEFQFTTRKLGLREEKLGPPPPAPKITLTNPASFAGNRTLTRGRKEKGQGFNSGGRGLGNFRRHYFLLFSPFSCTFFLVGNNLYNKK